MTPYLAVFLSVLIAELGDKTQLATLLFAANPAVKASGVFLAAAGALVVSTAVAVTVGAQIGTTVSARALKTVAGIGFLLIGLWTLLDRS
jgi:putative Ca2+/H+ antiporter (TMEM165/GDT1 family)